MVTVHKDGNDDCEKKRREISCLVCFIQSPHLLNKIDISRIIQKNTTSNIVLVGSGAMSALAHACTDRVTMLVFTDQNLPTIQY